MAHAQPGSRSRLPVIKTALRPQRQASTSSGSSAARAVRTDSGDTTENNLATARAVGEKTSSVRNIGRQLPANSVRNRTTTASRADGQSLSQRRLYNNLIQPVCSLPKLVGTTRITPEWMRRVEGFQEAIGRRVTQLHTQMNNQRLEMATDLLSTREALQIAQRERAEAEQKVKRIETGFVKLERRLEERHKLDSREIDQQGDEIRKLKRQVKELVKRLILMHRNNVVTPPASPRGISSPQQQSRNTSQHASSKALHLEEHFPKILEHLTQSAAHLNAMSSDMRHAHEQNLQAQNYISSARSTLRRLVERVLLTPMARNNDADQLRNLMNVADHDLVLDKVMMAIANIMEPE